MIKKELKTNLKSFIIYLSLLSLMFLFVYLIYPFIINDENMEKMNELLSAFPSDVLKAFNMDISSIDTAFGWVKSEGFVFALIVMGIYASILGSNIVFKEEVDRTIEYLSFLPITRKKIMTNKIISSLILLFSMVIIFGLFNFIALLISSDFNKKEFFLLFISPLLIVFPLFFLNLFISTLTKRNKKLIGLSIGLVFIFYILNMLSELSEKVEFLKYFSVYSLANTRQIIIDSKIGIFPIIISVLLSVILALLSFIFYDKKELV